MMRSNGVPSEKELQFKLGDVVLCRYSSYPYWPATVDQTHQKKYKGKHYAMLRTKGGDLVLCFWCTFSNEDTGGWVRADRMVLFHPAILSKIRVAKDNEWYNDQKEAIESAIKSFRVMYKETEKKVPQLPIDMEKGFHSGKWDVTDKEDIISDDEASPEPADDEDPMDLGDESEEGEPPSRRHSGRPTKGGKTPARPKAQKEPRKAVKRKSLPAEEPRPKKRSKTSTKLEKDLLDGVDNDSEEPRKKVRDRDVEEEVMDRSSGKRRRHSYAHPGEPSKKMRKIEAELASTKEALANLKKTLRKREKALAELTGDGAGVACVIPPLPPPIAEPTLDKQEFRSSPVNSEKFNAMMDTLSDDYESFKKAAEVADEARTELEEAMETIKKLYREASEKVSVAEDKATKKESDLVRILREILEADVQVQNLRERKAGHVVRGMLKKCKDLPAIRSYCDAIYKSWKAQVVIYMKENEGKLKQESPSGAKSPPGDKSERKGSESPSADAKTPPKDIVKEEEEQATDDKSKKEGKEEDVEMKDTKPGSEKKTEEPRKTKEEAKEKEEVKRVKGGEPKKAKEGVKEKEGVKRVKGKEPKKAKPEGKEQEGSKVEEGPKTSAEEASEKAPKPASKGKAEKDETRKRGKAEEPTKEASDKPDENKSDDTKRENEPKEKEVSDPASSDKPDAKVEEKDRPPAKGENK